MWTANWETEKKRQTYTKKDREDTRSLICIEAHWVYRHATFASRPVSFYKITDSSCMPFLPHRFFPLFKLLGKGKAWISKPTTAFPFGTSLELQNIFSRKKKRWLCWWTMRNMRSPNVIRKKDHIQIHSLRFHFVRILSVFAFYQYKNLFFWRQPFVEVIW